jgi:hypothetical protein
MKSLEVKFNEALTELKKKVSASKYDAVCKEYMKLTTLETKLNCVEAAWVPVKESDTNTFLGRMQAINAELDEAMNEPGMAVLFDKEPKTKATNKESAPIKKHAGSAEMFVEGSPFNGDRANAVSATNSNPAAALAAKSNKIMVDFELQTGRITEAQHRKLTGQKPAEYDTLSEQQRKHFDDATMLGFNESDSLKLARMTGSTFREASRR